jgi:hypothetical protein
MEPLVKFRLRRLRAPRKLWAHKHWRRVLIPVCLCSAIAVLTAWTATPKYAGTVLLSDEACKHGRFLPGSFYNSCRPYYSGCAQCAEESTPTVIKLARAADEAALRAGTTNAGCEATAEKLLRLFR